MMLLNKKCIASLVVVVAVAVAHLEAEAEAGRSLRPACSTEF